MIIVVSVVILLTAALVVWWQFFSKTEEPVINNTTVQTNTNIQTVVVNTATNEAPATNTATEEDDEVSLTRLANLFVERFGSYSSDAKFSNLTELRPYMTDRMKTWSDDFINIQLTTGTDQTYYAVLTDVITVEVDSIKGDSATVTVTTQRRETKADSTEFDTPFYQTITISANKVGGVWLVDQATWNEKGLPEPASESSEVDPSESSDFLNSLTNAEAVEGN